MTLVLDGHDREYEMRNLCFLFFPGEKVTSAPADFRPQGDSAVTRIFSEGGRTFAGVTVTRSGVSAAERECITDGMTRDEALGRAFYRAAVRVCGFRPPWGILTGIRPAKLARDMLARSMTREQAEKQFIEKSYLSAGKASLCVETAVHEEEITRLSRPESVSLYISVPFCPTRCLYCSFISSQVERCRALLPDYVRLLCSELEATAGIISSLGLRLETVYMGGGTPTTLSAQQLAAVLGCVADNFDLSHLRELTVEAGRPDTITPEKLAAIRDGGATRICINPQTLDDAVLRRIGRAHTASQVFDAFRMARAAGMGSINMDLIAGLPGDTPEGFRRSLDGVLALGPESVTVHTLAMKRSSRLVTEGEATYDARGQAAAQMQDYARGALCGAGMRPYYLYRQRNTAGNLENVGYALPGHEGLYNVFIMDETHTVLAAGAGAVTKMRAPHGSRIERVFNFKYPDEYIRRFGEILDRKKQVVEFYGQNDRQG
jgi:oxygen-independent coproporphyrinogen-3 oxidase